MNCLESENLEFWVPGALKNLQASESSSQMIAHSSNNNKDIKKVITSRVMTYEKGDDGFTVPEVNSPFTAKRRRSDW